MDAATCTPCAVGSISVNGVCTPCAPEEVAVNNLCVACDPGSVPAIVNGLEVCSPCTGNSVSVNGACVECANTQTADPATNTCLDCPADLVVDLSAQEIGPCNFYNQVAAPFVSGSACDEVFIVEYTNLDAILACGLPEVDLSAVSTAGNEADCEVETHFTVDTRTSTGTWGPSSLANKTGSWPDCTDCLAQCALDFTSSVSNNSISIGTAAARVAVRPGRLMNLTVQAGAGPIIR